MADWRDFWETNATGMRYAYHETERLTRSADTKPTKELNMIKNKNRQTKDAVEEVLKTDKPTVAKTETKVETIAVAALARDNGKDPKQVRARLRRLYADPAKASKLPKPITMGKWVFNASDMEAVLELVLASGK